MKSRLRVSQTKDFANNTEDNIFFQRRNTKRTKRCVAVILYWTIPVITLDLGIFLKADNLDDNMIFAPHVFSCNLFSVLLLQ
jgi:hypothetical protein